MNVAQLKEKIDVFLEAKFIPLAVKLKLAILAGMLFLPAVAWWFFLFTPTTDEIKLLKNRLGTLTTELNEVKAFADKIGENKAMLEATDTKLKEAAILLPQKQEIPSLLTNISNLGTQAGLEFVKFVPAKEKPQEFYAEIPVEIEVRGPYHNVGVFLDGISKLPRLVTVENMEMRSPVVEMGVVTITSRFTLVTYRFIEAEVDKSKDAEKTKKK